MRQKEVARILLQAKEEEEEEEMDLVAQPGKASKKVMVVADPSRESEGALEWAISRALVDHDGLILLHIDSTVAKRSTFAAFLRRPNLMTVVAALAATERGGGEEFLEEMKMTCEAAKSKVRVQIARAEMAGMDKASAILLQTKVYSVDVLVIGQRRSFLPGWPNKGLDTADYLIENSGCQCVGVQKKGQKLLASGIAYFF